jgi:hypothetical protein
MRYRLYLVKDGDGMTLMLAGENEPLPKGDAQLVRAFASREKALEAMARLESEFVFPLQRCLARAEVEAS